MTTTHLDPVEFIRNMLRNADTDMAAFFEMFSSDCEFRMGNSDVVRGREAIIAWVSDYLGSVAGIEHHVLEAWSEGDIAAARVEVTYTMANGESFTLPAVTRTRVKDNQATEYLIFMDPSPVVAAS